MRHNGLANLRKVSGAAVAFARAVTDASGGRCSDLLGVIAGDDPSQLNPFR
jgi:arginine repressor